MMEFSDLVKKRRSNHFFQKGFKIAESDFDQILEYVRYTPSGYNAQPWKFKLIQEDAQLKDLHPICYNQDHILEAGNLVVVLGDKDFGKNETDRIISEWVEFRDFNQKKAEALKASLVKDREDWKKKEMVIRGCSMAAMHFLFAAEDLGFSTCPMMGCKQLELRTYLALPENLLPVMLIALGKADTSRIETPLPRKSVDDLKWFDN